MKIAAIIVTILCLLTFVQRLPEIRSEGTAFMIGSLVGTLLIPGILWLIVLVQANKKKKEKDINNF